MQNERSEKDEVKARLFSRRSALAAMLGVCAGTLISCGKKGKAPVRSPDQYKVRLQTTKGDVILLVHRDWAPHGADHFYELLKMGFYDDNRFFRAVRGFVVQFGMNGDPKVNGDWANITIPDDPPKMSNKTGTITFANSGPDSRSTQVFINLADNVRLDSMDFPPFGEVIEGMDHVEHFYMDYGDGPPNGDGPDQSDIAATGNAFLDHRFPNLDRLIRARVIS
jgi:peptidyl-prolyl cis-trans isomerase A (cyclophilin A)